MSEQKDTAVPRFFMNAIENKAKSKDEGRPIFDEIEMIEIRIPGDSKTVFVDHVYRKDGEPNGAGMMNNPPCYIERWPNHYARFKNAQTQAQTGTPLAEWPQMTVSKVAELRAINIFTVENLADLSDGFLGKLGMGGRELREKARAFIAKAKDSAAETKIAAENAALKAQLDAMQAQMNAFMAQHAPAAPAQDKALEDCTDAELKAFIARETGESVRGNPSRDTLLKRAAELAQAQAA